MPARLCGLRRFGLLVEGDVVDIEAVVIAVDASILRVLPLEGVRTGSDVEVLLGPVADTSVLCLLDAVDVEVTIVPAALAGDLAEVAHDTVGRDVDRNSHVAHHARNAGATALHAVSAFVGLVGSDSPRIVGIHLPIEHAEVASLEVFDDFATGQTAAPVHLHVRAVRIQAVGIVFGDDLADGIEVLIHDVVDRAGGLVVDDHDRFTLDRLVGGLITILGGLAVVARTSVHSAAVVTLGVGHEVVGVVHTELIRANHGDGGVGDTSGTVLLVDVTVHVAAAGDLHNDSVRRSGFALIVHGGDIVGIAVHVVGQRTIGVGAQVDLVDRSLTDLLTVAVDVVVTIGTVNNRSPVEDDLFVVEHGLINHSQVLRNVEVGGEAPDRAAHTIRASGVVELDMPEVVGVVPQVADSVAVGHIGAEAAILRIHDRLRVVRIRVIGATEHQSPTSGIFRNHPTQGHAGGLDFVGIVSRLRAEGKAFGLDGRARHLVHINIYGVVSLRGGGNQIIGASRQAQVGDDGTGASERAATRSDVELDVVNIRGTIGATAP